MDELDLVAGGCFSSGVLVSGIVEISAEKSQEKRLGLATRPRSYGEH